MKMNEDTNEENLIGVYSRLPVTPVSGDGVKIEDAEGKGFLDFVAGIAVNSVGHCHPKVVEAIKKQSEKLIHCSNLYHIPSQAKLAKKISEISFADKLFFCNSGTEAMEAAIKLARRASDGHEILAAEGSFHGRTIGSLSATWKEKYKKPFKPLVPGFSFVKYGDVKSLEEKISEDTAAVILEPVQGEGGVNIPPEGYLDEVREICDENSTLLVFDEVQTGFGRTGKMFGYQHSNIEPDIMGMAKSLGGGFPIGAMGASKKVAEKLEGSDHASTFGGNPLACEAALASIEVIEEEKLVSRSREMGIYFRDRLKEIDKDWIKDVRGLGLLIALETEGKAADILKRGLNEGILLNKLGDDTLRFVPPLTVKKSQIDRVVSIIE